MTQLYLFDPQVEWLYATITKIRVQNHTDVARLNKDHVAMANGVLSHTRYVKIHVNIYNVWHKMMATFKNSNRQ